MKKGIIYFLIIALIALAMSCAHVTESPPMALPETARVEETAVPQTDLVEELR
jgi:hypothetical protein